MGRRPSYHSRGLSKSRAMTRVVSVKTRVMLDTEHGPRSMNSGVQGAPSSLACRVMWKDQCNTDEEINSGVETHAKDTSGGEVLNELNN